VSNGVRLSGVIESPRNERIRKLRRLRKRNFRYREGMFLAEGLQAVVEALRSPYEVHCLMCNARGMSLLEPYGELIAARRVPCFMVSDEVMKSLSDTVTPQGLIAAAGIVHREVEEILTGSPSTILVANRVRDPGNLGNMVRIADAAGARGMIVCRESADLYNPKTVRSTAGSIFRLPLAVDADIGETVRALKHRGYVVYAADAHAGVPLWETEWHPQSALLMGNEAWGLPPGEEEAADAIVSIPLYGGAESLNVSAAAAVILYEVARRRVTG